MGKNSKQQNAIDRLVKMMAEIRAIVGDLNDENSPIVMIGILGFDLPDGLDRNIKSIGYGSAKNMARDMAHLAETNENFKKILLSVAGAILFDESKKFTNGNN